MLESYFVLCYVLWRNSCTTVEMLTATFSEKLTFVANSIPDSKERHQKSVPKISAKLATFQSIVQVIFWLCFFYCTPSFQHFCCVMRCEQSFFKVRLILSDFYDVAMFNKKKTETLCSLSPRRTSHNSWIAEWFNGRHALAVQQEKKSQKQICKIVISSPLHDLHFRNFIE